MCQPTSRSGTDMGRTEANQVSDRHQFSPPHYQVSVHTKKLARQKASHRCEKMIQPSTMQIEGVRSGLPLQELCLPKLLGGPSHYYYNYNYYFPKVCTPSHSANFFSTFAFSLSAVVERLKAKVEKKLAEWLGVQLKAEITKGLVDKCRVIIMMYC